MNMSILLRCSNPLSNTDVTRNKALVEEKKNQQNKHKGAAIEGVHERISGYPPTQWNRSRGEAPQAGHCRRSLSVPASHHGATVLCFIEDPESRRFHLGTD